eukprot:scaffold71021_cov33-Tisochrysis_lutea.AAC.4
MPDGARSTRLGRDISCINALCGIWIESMKPMRSHKTSAALSGAPSSRRSSCIGWSRDAAWTKASSGT